MTLMYAIRNGSARLGTFVAYRGRAGGYQPGGWWTYYRHACIKGVCLCVIQMDSRDLLPPPSPALNQAYINTSLHHLVGEAIDGAFDFGTEGVLRCYEASKREKRGREGGLFFVFTSIGRGV